MDVKAFRRAAARRGFVVSLTLFWFAPVFSQQLGPVVSNQFFYKAEKPQQNYFPKESHAPGGFYVGMEVSYLLLNGVDLATTFYGLERGAREANPIANYIIKNKPVTVAVKASLTVGTLWAVRQMRKENRTAATVTLGILNLLYSGVVANNLRVVVEL